MGYCKLCSKETKNENELCGTCENKRKATKIVLNLQDKINFKEKMNNTYLYNLGYEDTIRRNDLLWTLQETNIITKINDNDYEWKDLDKIEKFVKKYDKNLGQNLHIGTNTQQKQQNTCKQCGKIITTTKTKQKYCKDCKKVNKTLKNIQFINKHQDQLNKDKLLQETSKKDYQIDGIIFDLIENDLIEKIDEQNYQKNPEKIAKYLEEHKQTQPKEEFQNKPSDNKEEKPDKEKTSTPTREEKTPKTPKTSTNNAENSYPMESSGYILYKELSNNRIILQEYKELIKAMNNIKNGYSISPVYLLNDYENIKWIKDLNSFYEYNDDDQPYETTIYNYDEITKKYPPKKEKTVLQDDEYITRIKKKIKPNVENQKDKQTPTHKKKQKTKYEILEEFFNKHIQIDNTGEGLHDLELFTLFRRYAYNQYNIKIQKFGVEAYNSLIAKKREENHDIKAYTNNGKIYYNLAYNSDDDKTTKHETKKGNVSEDTNKNKEEESIPQNILNFIKNKKIHKIQTKKEIILIYNDILTNKEYLTTMTTIENTKEHISNLNITRITKEKININIEYRLKNKEINKTTKHSTKKYTLNDHAYLKPGNTSYTLFNNINEKIMNIGQNIARSIHKQTISYNSQERFVDLIINKSSIRISINVPIYEVQDPRNICEDMRDIGSWASGITRFKLEREEDIDYAMSLIRQSYDYVNNKNKQKNNE